MLAEEEGAEAVRLARRSVGRLFGPNGSDRERSVLPPVFRERRGAFVTWKVHPGGGLRGCIGYPLPVLALAEAIERAAVSAALEDPRFPPVTPEEFPELFAEVSVLGVPTPVPLAERASSIRPGVDGLIVEAGSRSGLLLPQVALEQGWNTVELLDGTCEKAGLAPGAWRRPSVTVRSFRAEVFQERSPGGVVARLPSGVGAAGPTVP